MSHTRQKLDLLSDPSGTESFHMQQDIVGVLGLAA